jgi:hypothetical protein
MLSTKPPIDDVSTKFTILDLRKSDRLPQHEKATPNLGGSNRCPTTKPSRP